MRISTFPAALILLTASQARAQAPTDSLEYPPRGHYQHSAVIIAPYDPAQNRTVLQVKPFPIDSTLRLSALAALVGREATGQYDGGIVITMWSTGSTLFTNPPVSFELADGGTLDLGKAWSSPDHAPEYTEVMLCALSVPAFLRLVRSPTGVLHVGTHRFPLTELHMNALRDFASRLAPRPSR